MPKPKGSRYWTGAHTVHRLMYHVTFVPKYRRKVLRGDLVRRLQELFYEGCRVNRWYIHELEVMPDHVHMLLQLPAKTPVSEAIGYLKGGSSRVIRKEYPELEEFLWGDSLWQDGYFAETVGKVDEKTIRQYIKTQWQREQQNTSSGL